MKKDSTKEAPKPAKKTTKVAIAGEKVKIYKEPALWSEVVEVKNYGDQVVTDADYKDGTWVKVTGGYVMKAFVKKV